MWVTFCRLILTTMSCALLASCAATPTTLDNEKSDVSLSKYDSVQVIVSAPPFIKQQTGYVLTSEALRTEFIDQLRNSGRFETVGLAVNGAKPLVAELVITRFNYVHGAARFFGGVFGGSAALGVTMTVRDKITGETLQTVTLHDGSKRLQGIFGATTGRQVSAMAREFAAELTGQVAKAE